MRARLEGAVNGVDVVADTVGGETRERSFRGSEAQRDSCLSGFLTNPTSHGRSLRCAGRLLSDCGHNGSVELHSRVVRQRQMVPQVGTVLTLE
jgi:hypothetical protein